MVQPHYSPGSGLRAVAISSTGSQRAWPAGGAQGLAELSSGASEQNAHQKSSWQPQNQPKWCLPSLASATAPAHRPALGARRSAAGSFQRGRSQSWSQKSLALYCTSASSLRVRIHGQNGHPELLVILSAHLHPPTCHSWGSPDADPPQHQNRAHAALHQLALGARGLECMLRSTPREERSDCPVGATRFSCGHLSGDQVVAQRRSFQLS